MLHVRRYSMTLGKQQVLPGDPQAIQQITFIENVNQEETMFFVIKEAKETILDFSQGTLRIL